MFVTWDELLGFWLGATLWGAVGVVAGLIFIECFSRLTGWMR
jgi:hypothetical protein